MQGKRQSATAMGLDPKCYSDAPEHPGNELLAEGREKKRIALRQLKEIHQSSETNTKTVATGIDTAVARIQQLAVKLKESQNMMKTKIRENGAAQFIYLMHVL